MAHRRAARGFRPVGAVDAGAATGLSAARVRDLRLQRAWIDVAGPALATRARAVRVARGILDLAVDDPRWARELRGLLPRLALGLARAEPALGIRRFRVLVEDAPAKAEPLPPVDGDESPASPPDSDDSGVSRSRDDRGAPAIEDLARRYLRAR